MPVDASIPLSFRPTTEIMSPGQLLSLKDLSQRVQQNQQEIQKKNQITQVLQSPGTVDPKSGRISLQGLGAITQLDPQMGLQLSNQSEQLRLRDLQINEKKQERGLSIEKAYVESFDRHLQATGGNRQEAMRLAASDRLAAIDEFEKSGEAAQMGFNESDLNRARQNMRDPDQVRAIVTGMGGTIAKGSTPLSDVGKLKADYEAGRIDEKTYKAELARKTSPPGGQDAPSGYRRSKDGNLEFIPGGPADPDKKTGSLGNRESVFISRVMLSANEAAKDLSNVVRLPTTASRGVFGGRQQGPSLFDAGQETLANKMTTQEVQSYNTLSAGFQRSLAAIESAGLAPSGTLSHQMDAVIFKEGDTNFTKLQKLAQTRQIVEAGLETTMSNPKLAKAQRDHIEEVLTSIRKSVPFTQGELITLQERQQINPNTTLADVMKATQGKSKYQYDDSEKEKRYQEYKKTHGG